MQQQQNPPKTFPRQELCEAVRWKERDAVRLGNGVIELIALTGGGHLAAFRFLDGDHRTSPNVLWEAPWPTFEPGVAWSPRMSEIYGLPQTGKFLAGYTGHALCLDYFGDPPAAMAAQGLGLHGEAAAVRWTPAAPRAAAAPHTAECRWIADLPVSGLVLEREIRLGDGESVAYVQQTVTNQRDAERAFDWVEHATFGPPFLTAGESTLLTSGGAGMVSPSGYDGKSLLPRRRFFRWPYVRRGAAGGVADLRLPFAEKGRGCLAGMRLDPARSIEFVLAINWKLRLGVGYCFRRDDFPWMTIWEENCSRQSAPWNGTAQARGMEFGTKPLPLPGMSGLPGKRFADTPAACRVAAHGKRTTRYLMFLFRVPAEIDAIEDVTPSGDAISFYADKAAAFSIPARGCEAFLSRFPAA